MKTLSLIFFFVFCYISYSQWEACNNGIPDLFANKIASRSNTLLTGTLSGGLFMSTDNGNNWSPKNYGLYNYKFATLATNGKNIYFLAPDGWNGIHSSSDSGKSWHNFSDLPGISSLSVSDTNVIYNVVNYGIVIQGQSRRSSFVASEKNGLPNLPYNVVVMNDNDLYASAFGEGIYISTDRGISWSRKNNGLANLNILSLVVSGNSVFAGTLGGGVFITTNNGDSWTEINNGLKDLDIISLTVDGGKIIAGTGGGVFISDNNGTSWSERNSGLTSLRVYSVAAKGDTMFAATLDGGIFFSSNNGQSWTARSNGIKNPAIGSVVICGDAVVAGTLADKMYVSTDNGESWNYKYAWLDGPCGMEITSILMEEGKIFVGTKGSGIYLSTNNGDRWVQKNKGLADLNITAIIRHKNYLCSGTSGKGIYVSTDDGDSWMQKDTLLFDNEITMLSSDSINLYAGASGKGLFVSADNGQTWLPKNNGIESLNITAIAFSNKNIIIGASEDYYNYPYSGHLYVSTDSGSSWIKKDNPEYEYRVYSILKYENILIASQPVFIRISTNDGLDWKSIKPGATEMTISQDNIYAASSAFGLAEGCYGKGIFKTKIEELIKTDVNELDKKKEIIKISPSPASDYIEIHGLDNKPGSLNRIIIYNALGECVFSPCQDYSSAQSARIDVSLLPLGVYYCVIDSETKKSTASFIVIR